MGTEKRQRRRGEKHGLARQAVSIQFKRAKIAVYCLHCERFVETKLVRPGSGGVTYVLAGLAIGCALPTLVGDSIGLLTVLSVIFGAALAIYLAWRRPTRYQVCASCGSPYIVKDMVPNLRRAA